jgi:hypothetical protein
MAANPAIVCRPVVSVVGGRISRERGVQLRQGRCAIKQQSDAEHDGRNSDEKRRTDFGESENCENDDREAADQFDNRFGA